MENNTSMTPIYFIICHLSHQEYWTVGNTGACGPAGPVGDADDVILGNRDAVRERERERVLLVHSLDNRLAIFPIFSLQLRAVQN